MRIYVGGHVFSGDPLQVLTAMKYQAHGSSDALDLAALVPGLAKDFTPIGFALSAACFLAGIYLHRLLWIMPVARSVLIQELNVGILAIELDVPVVPVFIGGAYEAFPRGTSLPRPKKVTVTFGRPLRPDEVKGLPRPQGVDEYQLFANVLRERVGELKRISG